MEFLNQLLDGLLYHESNLRIEEYSTDMDGFRYYVPALMHLLGFRFEPRIPHLKNTKLYVQIIGHGYVALRTMNYDNLNIKNLCILVAVIQFAASIKQGTVKCFS